jgi:YVTN family beta-propeller protein
VASGLSEEWLAVDLTGDAPVVMPERGLTGRIPNDLDRVGDRLYVVNSGENTVSVVDLATGRSTGCLDIGSGTNPWALFVDPADSTRGWLTTFLTGELLELDLAGVRVLRRRAVAPAMEGVWADSERVAVTLTGFNGTEGDFGQGEVVVFEKSTLTEVARFPVPTNPQFLFEGGDGRLHVICSGNFRDVTGRVVRIESDLSAARDTLVLGGSPSRAALAPDGVAYVAAFFGGLMAYDTLGFLPLHDAGNPLLDAPGFTDVLVQGGRLYAASFEVDAVAVLDLAGGTLLGEFLAGDGPVALALRADP